MDPGLRRGDKMRTIKMPELTRQLQILSEFCELKSWQFRLIDQFTGYLAEVRDGERSFITGAGPIPTFPLNVASFSEIARDKAHATTLLNDAGLATIEGDHFFTSAEKKGMRPDGRELDDALSYAESLGYSVFVKPNAGCRGLMADLVDSPENLKRHFADIAPLDHIAIVQAYTVAPEYRLFCLNGQVKFSYSKSVATLHGDGQQTVSALLNAYNAKFVDDPTRALSSHAPFLNERMKERGLNLQSVLPDGERLPLAARANLSTGGTLSDYRDEIEPAIQAWAEKVIKALPLPLCAIDLFATDGYANPEGYKIIEVNANPAFGGIYEAGHKDMVWALMSEASETAFKISS
jgi:D-alanine-D-alanine ligase-like ATP-grasp enzyme